jgi:translation initiation factor 5
MHLLLILSSIISHTYANRSVDPSYRYKMPKLVSKIEGRGNGIKSVIVNGPAIADSLHRPVSHLIKYFGCELGAQSKIDVKVR